MDNGFDAADPTSSQGVIFKNELRETTGHREILEENEDKAAPGSVASTYTRLIEYTPSGNLDTYESLAVDARKSDKFSPEFSKEIESVKFVQTLDGGKRHFKVTIHFSKGSKTETFGPLEFEFSRPEKTTTDNNKTKSKKNLADGFQYELSSQCMDSNCAVVKANLYRLKSSQIVAQASLLYTTTMTRLKTLVAKSSEETPEDTTTTAPVANPSETAFINQISQQKAASKETFVVVDGKSSTTIRVMDPLAPAKELLSVSTPVVRTNEGAISANKVEVADPKVAVQAELQGSDIQSGDVALDLSIGTQQAGPRVRLLIENASPSITPASPSSPRTEIKISQYNEAVFPLMSKNISEAQLATTQEVTKRLEPYRSHVLTKKYVDMWILEKHPRVGFCNQKTYYTQQRAQRFLTQMGTKVKDQDQSLGELTSLILNKIDAFPQLAYLGALEGNYWNDFNADIIVPYNPKAGKALRKGDARYKYWSDASGPYGCLTDTCRQIIRANKQLLENAGLSLQVSYVTPMERQMFNERIKKGIREDQIKRGDLRTEIFNSGKEAEYAKQRQNASLLDTDSRKFFATATLLAGLEVRRLVFERKAYENARNLPNKTSFKWELRKDPALAILAYHAGMGLLAKYAVCSQLSSEKERKNCQRSMSVNRADQKRHEGFDTTLDEITKYSMAPCEQLDYTWAWLALQFIGTDPMKYNLEIQESKSPALKFADLLPAGIKFSSLFNLGRSTLL
jgi:hypothetical protein